MTGYIRYVAGFAFNDTRTRVVLIEKKHGPDIVLGKWNAVGGKCEGTETRAEAMAREFREETGIATKPGDWTQYLELRFGTGSVMFFKTGMSPDVLLTARTMTDETVMVQWVHDVELNAADAASDIPLVPGLGWQLGMALDNTVHTAVAEAAF